MASPYRGGPTGAPSEPGDEGLVGDLVRQFADPLAFYRELVQNAIDAKASRIDIELTAVSPEELRVEVADDGVGMDRDVVENALLVLFRSTKEGKEGTIGKFGVGFVSVLALGPRLVEVETKAEGHEALVLHLHPDHRFELYEDEARTSRGTVVRLSLPLPAARWPAFVEASVDALGRWCRHASVPIHLRAWLDAEGPPTREARIERPIDLDDALVTVARSSADGRIRAVVGLPRAGKARAGFFNHGLTLFETDEPLVRGVAFKVQDARLGHTLSRDNVRRDAAFERAVDFVREQARGSLVLAAYRELEAAAAAKNRERYGIVLAALMEVEGFEADARLPLLLAVPCRGAPHGTLEALRRPRLASIDAPTPLAEALGREGVALVDRTVMGQDPARRAVLDGWLERAYPDRFDPHLLPTATLFEPVEAGPADAALVDALTEALAAHHRRPSGVILARLDGRAAGAPCCAGTSDPLPRVLYRETEDDPFRLLLRPPLALDARHPAVALARKAAARSPRLAAHVLARVVLLRYGALDEARCGELGGRLLETLAAGGRP